MRRVLATLAREDERMDFNHGCFSASVAKQVHFLKKVVEEWIGSP